jgi:predicted PurR-regulated permease PerM
MNQQSFTMPAIVGVVAGLIAAAIWEVISKLTGGGFKHAIPVAAIIGVVVLIIGFGVTYFMGQSQTKKPA